MVTGMSHAARGQHQAALEAFAAGAQAQSLLTGVHALATPVVGWLAATQARLGMLDEARETLTGFSAEPGRPGPGFVYNTRAVICMAEGDPAGALDVLRDVPDVTPATGPEGKLVMVSDRGHFVSGRLLYDEAGAPLALAGVTIDPIQNSKGADLPRAVFCFRKQLRIRDELCLGRRRPGGG